MQDASPDLSQAKTKADETDKRARLAKGELGLDIYKMRPKLAEAGLVYLDTLDDYKTV